MITVSPTIPPEDLCSMSCVNCGSAALIKAHLIPRVFAVEVKVGKSFAVGVASGDKFKTSQSGVWDKEILCGPCDGILGEYENYAYGVTKRIRAYKDTQPWQQQVLSNVDVEKLLRFCAGILYKFSLTKPQNGRIKLGKYQEVLRRFIFEPGADCPAELDAWIVRPLRLPNDDGVFAYRAPRGDRKHGLSYFRMMMGGVIFFINLNARGASLHPLKGSFIKAHPEEMTFTTVAAQTYEEFTIPARLVNEGRLSEYLDHVEGQM